MTDYEQHRIIAAYLQVLATLVTPFVVWYFIKRRNK